MNASGVIAVEVEEVMVPGDDSGSNHRDSQVYKDSYIDGFNR